MESIRDPKHESNTDVSPIGKVYSKHFGRSNVHCPQFLSLTILALSNYKLLGGEVDPCKKISPIQYLRNIQHIHIYIYY